MANKSNKPQLNDTVNARANRTRKRLLSLIFMLGIGSFIASCGKDGADGATGAQGPAGDTIIINNEAESIALTIDSVSTTSEFTVHFNVVDQDDMPFTGLGASEVRFTLAKLVPGTSGDSDSWQSYINRVEQPGGAGPGTEAKLQATAERNGSFVNHQDGSYSYTFSTPILSVTDPVVVEYEPNLVHRVAIQIGGEFAPLNASYTFVPATGATEGLNQHKLVTTETCNNCHGELALHGGGRVEMDYCVTCHNPGTADAQSGETVDFKVMIHKIHRGSALPSVEAGNDYIIWGFRNSEHDYSDVHYPQSINNCSKCHDDENSQTPQAANWYLRPTLEACGSCHDDIDFSAGVAGGHEGGVVTDNSECTTCHAPDRVAGSVQESHALPALAAAEKFQFNILSVTQSGPGEFPVIQFSITDPTNADTPYSLAGNHWNGSGGNSRLQVLLAWNTQDYANNEAGRAPATAASVNALNATDNGDGSYTVTSTIAIPASMTGSGAVALEGRAAADLDGDGSFTDRIPITGAVSYFAITDTSPEPRRDVVETSKCQNCHGVRDGLAFHGGNRTDNVQLCVMCHNPNNTDLAMRPTDPDGTDNETNAAAADGMEEQTIDFKQLIHAIHGADKREQSFVVYGFRNSVHDYSDAHFPNDSANCLACHNAASLSLPLKSYLLGSTIDSQATVNTSSPFGSSDLVPAMAATDHSDDENISPTAAACTSCHDSSLAQNHMMQNGAAFNALQGELDSDVFVETCAVCHGPGRSADIEQVHRLKEPQ